MYCFYGRRGHAKGASGIGAWAGFIELTSFVAVIVNCALIFYTANAVLTIDWFKEMDAQQKFFWVVIAEHIMIAFKILIQQTIPDVPSWIIREEVERDALKDEVLYKVTRRVKKKEKELGLNAPKDQDANAEDQSIYQVNNWGATESNPVANATSADDEKGGMTKNASREGLLGKNLMMGLKKKA